MNFNPRIEEYHLIGAVTYSAYEDNKTDLINYSPDFDGTFDADFKAKIFAATNMATTQFYIAELSALTKKIGDITILIFPMLNGLEGYIGFAKKELTKDPKKYGIKAVRDYARADSSEGLSKAFKTLFDNVEVPDDYAAIKARGLKDADYALLKDTAAKLMAANDEQEYYKSKKAIAVNANRELFNDLLETVKKVQMAGKILYKFTDKAKTDSFTMSVIIGRIRHDELHTLITGTAMDENGVPVYKAKIVAKPTKEGKRTQTVYTNKEGVYELRGLKPINFDITCTLKNGKIIVANATAVTNETVRVDFRV